MEVGLSQDCVFNPELMLSECVSHDYTGVAVVFVCVAGFLGTVMTLGYFLNIAKFILRGEADPRHSVRLTGIFVPLIGSIVGWMR